MRKKRKILAVAIASLFVLSMLAGCGPDSTQTQGDSGTLEGQLASAEPITMTIHMHYGNINVFDDNAPIYKEAAKLTNVTLRGTASAAATDSNQAFNTMLVESKLPDIIHGTSTNTNKAGMEGAMIPLEDLVKQYAPNIQKYFDTHPEALRGSLAADGHLYYIPCIYEKGPAMGWFIRQDWLDKLSLPVPTTVEEYYNTLKAFRDNDPNGNGKKDEIPYFDRSKSVKNLVPLFGVDKNYYAVGPDGKIYAPTATEGYKTAMTELAKWYAEGLIDQEVYSRGSTTREQLLGDNIGGATHDWFSSSLSFNDKLKDLVPGFRLATIDPPADINGEVKNASPRTTLNGNGWGISKDNQHVAETMRFFDFWFTEAGITLNSYGVEGTDYTIVNGVKEYTQQAKDYAGGVPSYMGTFGSREIGIPVSLEAEIKGMNKDAAEGFAMYVEKDYTILEFPNLPFNVEENRVIKDKGAAIKTYVDETTQGWIMGNTDVAATWDKYVNDLKAMGLDEVISAYQSAYDRYQSL